MNLKEWAARSGIVGHGLFLYMADEVILADPQGTRVIGHDQ